VLLSGVDVWQFKEALAMDERLVHALQQRWGATLIETHISWVLLDGVHAWKFKKPVHLPFLDFTELATRHRLCEVELMLNCRLAPQLYLDVQPICGTPDAPEVNGHGPAIEYVLRMKQFPAGALMSERLIAGTLLPEHIDQLAHNLAAFHRVAPVAPTDSPYGTPQRIEDGMANVLAGLAQQGHGQAVSTVQTWATQQAQALRDTWAQRRANGHIVEGHGDLHLANVVVLEDTVTAFDCIEFDPALRWIDTSNDIAFLIMDLMVHQRSDLAFRFLNAYLDETGDHACLPTLRFYMVYRALVRALVAGLQGLAANVFITLR
jgi:aminoglycoside phosphotransferase family enzyme